MAVLSTLSTVSPVSTVSTLVLRGVQPFVLFNHCCDGVEANVEEEDRRCDGEVARESSVENKEARRWDGVVATNAREDVVARGPGEM